MAAVLRRWLWAAVLRLSATWRIHGSRLGRLDLGNDAFQDVRTLEMMLGQFRTDAGGAGGWAPACPLPSTRR